MENKELETQVTEETLLNEVDNVKETLDEMNEETGVTVTVGDKKCFLYFNTQLTKVSRDGELIQIGIVDSDGRTFYGEFTDYNIKNVSTHVFENVIKKMDEIKENSLDGDHWEVRGDTEFIRKELYFWLNKYIGEQRNLQFVGDVCAHDFVFLMELLVDENNGVLPGGISPCVIDINQDIASTALYRKNDNPDISDDEFNSNFVAARAALEINRWLFIEAIEGDVTPYSDKIALNNAFVTKVIHQYLWNLQ